MPVQHRMALALIIFLVILVFSLCGTVFSGVTETANSTLVDWGNSRLVISGMVPMAHGRHSAGESVKNPFHKAIIQAMGFFFDSLSSLRYDSEMTVQDFLMRDEGLKEELQLVFDSCQIQSAQQGINGIFEANVAVPFYGEFGLAKSLFYKMVPPQEKSLGLAVRRYLDSATSEPSESIWTGLVVNAKSLGLKPCFSPKFLSRQETVFFSIDRVDFQAALDGGVVAYDDDLDSAMKNEFRVGKKPLLINAIHAGGSFKADLYFLFLDSKKILDANQWTNFLEKCRVIIVI